MVVVPSMEIYFLILGLLPISEIGLKTKGNYELRDDEKVQVA